MWRDVFLTNKDAVLEMLGTFNEDLSKLTPRDPPRRRRGAVRTFLAAPRAIRRGIVEIGQDFRRARLRPSARAVGEEGGIEKSLTRRSLAPACGVETSEARSWRVGVRGTLHTLGLAESPPHPKPSASTSPRKRGEVIRIADALRALIPDFKFQTQPHRHCEPTGRANARQMTGFREAIHKATRKKAWDCFVAFRLRSLSYGGQVAPRNDVNSRHSFATPAARSRPSRA